MKYENASEILPIELLKELQKYAAGRLLYVPTREGKRAWGEMSGYREQLKKRNRMIRNKYAHGVTVSELADEYFLSLDSIKKILYSKSDATSLKYSPTVESAVSYANAGLLEEWSECYRLLTQKANLIAQEHAQEDSLYFGVVKFPLRLIQCEESDIGESFAGESDRDAGAPPPLLIQYEEGKFFCTMQREFLTSMKQQRVNAYPSIIVLKENTEYKRFMKYYGNVLVFVDHI